jgi:hypothetical protein
MAEEQARFAGSVRDWKERLDKLNQLRERPVLRAPTGTKWRLARRLTGPFRTPLLALLYVVVATLGLLLALSPIAAVFIPSWLLPHLVLWAVSLPLGLQSSLDAFRLLFLIQVLSSALWLLRERKRDPSTVVRDLLRAKAQEIAVILEPKYIVFGHTHEPDLVKLKEDVKYFNTGTWTRIFSHEERWLREEKELSFLQILPDKSKTKARLLKWEGSASEAKLLYLFSTE